MNPRTISGGHRVDRSSCQPGQAISVRLWATFSGSTLTVVSAMLSRTWSQLSRFVAMSGLRHLPLSCSSSMGAHCLSPYVTKPAYGNHWCERCLPTFLSPAFDWESIIKLFTSLLMGRSSLYTCGTYSTCYDTLQWGPGLAISLNKSGLIVTVVM